MRPSWLTVRRAEVGAGALIAIAAIIIRLWSFGGVTFGLGYDDARYVEVAKNLANGFLPIGPGEWFGTRIVLLWPIAALFRFVGTTDYTAVAWPLVGSLAGVAAAFLVGRELVGNRVGLVAAGLVAAAPLEVLYATRLRPDSWQPALIALSVWAGLRARRPESRRLRWAAGCGLLLGAAWSVRESAPVMIPVLAVVIWPAGRRALAAAAGGALAVPLGSAALFAAVGGSFGQPLTSTASTAVWRDPITAWNANPSYTWMLWRDAFNPGGLLFLLGPTLITVAAILLVRRPRPALIPALWLGWAALYLEFGTLVNVAKPTRYLTLAAIPAAVLIAVAIDSRVALLAPIGVAAIAVAALAPLPSREHRADDVVLLNRVVGRLNELGPGPVLSQDYTWMMKIAAYRASARIPVPRVLEPTYLTPAERRRNRQMRPLPSVADYRGGFVVVGPVHRRSGWPLNWGIFQRRVRQEVPFSRLVPVARVGPATIYRWPADRPPLAR